MKWLIAELLILGHGAEWSRSISQHDLSLASVRRGFSLAMIKTI